MSVLWSRTIQRDHKAVSNGKKSRSHAYFFLGDCRETLTGQEARREQDRVEQLEAEAEEARQLREEVAALKVPA